VMRIVWTPYPRLFVSDHAIDFNDQYFIQYPMYGYTDQSVCADTGPSPVQYILAPGISLL
jgi:hypothetical protein